MTVNEMIRELQAIADAGYGEVEVVSCIITDWGSEEIDTVEYHDDSNQVCLY